MSALGGCAAVIGGTGGLGQSICRRFCDGGWDVAFTFRSSEESATRLLEDLRESRPKCFSHKIETNHLESLPHFIAQCVSTFGRIDAFVHAAGPDIPQEYFARIQYPLWKSTCTQEIDFFFSSIQSVLPIFRTQGHGAMVALTTIATKRYPTRDSLSAVPKAAIEQMVLAIAKEEGRFNIRANCVAPGIIEAGLGRRMMARDLDPETVISIRKDIPLKRFGTSEDVASLVFFLCSEEAAYITGQIVSVDGGWGI